MRKMTPQEEFQNYLPEHREAWKRATATAERQDATPALTGRGSFKDSHGVNTPRSS